MALGIAIKKRNVTSASKRVLAILTFDNAYPVGGYPVTPANFEIGTLHQMQVAGVSVGGFVAAYDAVAAKVKCFKVGAAGPLTECVANEAALANEIVHVAVEGDQVNDG